ncbi:ATP-binding protein [Agromyces atrinae]|uniref:Uridine kinase n=1 Tax=Agromyces atrinae TaxID=592376 RepID=A0A852SHY3_9MICO|nr:ATP-binding protein [Agromyces atrinae]NYD66519.1 uridine kinase [Agromyces atrinae]
MTPDEALRAILHRDDVSAILIDGPSGSGKSTFADSLVAARGARPTALVRLDDIYPGWSGLDAAIETVQTGILGPWRRGERGGWRRWDWARNEPGEWADVAPGLLVVEGCGAFGDDVTRSRVLFHVWVSAPDAVRKTRALERDAGGFDEHWTMWDEQWRAYVDRADPERRADIVVDTDAPAAETHTIRGDAGSTVGS